MNPNYIRYTNSIDDLIAWHIYHLKNFPSMRRDFYMYQIGIPGVIFAFFLCQAILQKDLSALIAGFLGALVGYILSNCSYDVIIKGTVKKILRDGSAKGILGEHILELINTDIIEKTNFNEMKNKISSLERIEITPEYAFIYINSFQAHVIPRSSILEGDFEDFIQELNRKREEN